MEIKRFHDLSDQEALERVLAGEDEAFALLYDRYARAIYRHILFRTESKEMSEDVTSQAFLRVWEYLRQGKPIASFRAFLYRTAQNALIDSLRRKESKNISLDEIYEKEGKEIFGEEDLKFEQEKTEDILALRQALQKIPSHYREIITLRYLDELTIGEIKKTTGKNFGTIYVSLYRGIKALRRALVEAQKPKNNSILK